MKPRIFIASPLFNQPQLDIIAKIEQTLTLAGFDYYSARQHSGSDKLSPEEKRVFENWQPVFDSNEDGLDECVACIAVLEYAMPEGHGLYAHTLRDLPELARQPEGETFFKDGASGLEQVHRAVRIEIPDAGTVWECGYMRAQGKPVFGFHTDKAKHLNLMLSHGCDGLVRGYDQLQSLLSGYVGPVPKAVERRKQRYDDQGKSGKAKRLVDASLLFNWSACEQFDAERKMVE